MCSDYRAVCPKRLPLGLLHAACLYRQHSLRCCFCCLRMQSAGNVQSSASGQPGVLLQNSSAKSLLQIVQCQAKREQRGLSLPWADTRPASRREHGPSCQEGSAHKLTRMHQETGAVSFCMTSDPANAPLCLFSYLYYFQQVVTKR